MMYANKDKVLMTWPQNFMKMLKDTNKLLYERCTKFNKLMAIVQLYHLKGIGG